MGKKIEGSVLNVRVLSVLEYSGQLALPGERLMRVFEPTVLRITDYLPELSRAREYGWIQERKPAEFLSSAALADRCVSQFFDLASRDD
jgi:hypothetical protein